jgi:hypothetical protein
MESHSASLRVSNPATDQIGVTGAGNQDTSSLFVVSQNDASQKMTLPEIAENDSIKENKT